MRSTLRDNGLGLVFGLLFLAMLVGQAVSGLAQYNDQQIAVGNREDPVTWLGYLGEPEFWNRMLQNWQSEMLAVGSMAVFAVYLRQRGSPESKPRFAGATQPLPGRACWSRSSCTASRPPPHRIPPAPAGVVIRRTRPG